jgi:hypothetical protein
MSETPSTLFLKLIGCCEPSPRHIEKRGSVANVRQFLCDFDTPVAVKPKDCNKFGRRHKPHIRKSHAARSRFRPSHGNTEAVVNEQHRPRCASRLDIARFRRNRSTEPSRRAPTGSSKIVLSLGYAPRDCFSLTGELLT